MTSGKKKKKVEREIEYRKTDESVIEPRRLKKQELRREIQGDDQVQRGEATQLEREREREVSRQYKEGSNRYWGKRKQRYQVEKGVEICP